MPVELGSFDVIIGMDWLANHHAVIVYDEKIVRIPFGDEVLIIQGDRDAKERSRMTKKEIENKLGEKRLKDVPTVRDFPEVFLEDLPRLPPTRQVEFQIDLVPGAAPVARAPYRLAPTELQEFEEEHAEHHKSILELLKEEKLYAKFSKCDWDCFSKTAKPMTKLTQKNVKFDWSEKAKAAFQFVEAESGMGSSFDATREKVIAGRRHYLLRNEMRCVIDHKSLQYILDQKELNMRQHRWLELLSDCDYEIRYHLGKANILEAQVEARKEENYGTEDLCGMIKKLEQRTQLDMSTAYHPQTDGQSERTIQTLEDMLRACVIDFGKGWRRSAWSIIVHEKKLRRSFRSRSVFKLHEIDRRATPTEKLSRVHSTFHVSNLKKCFVDEPLAIPLDEIQIDDKLNFIEELVEIMD
ncbi:putative reverse transcriptase domain-containing protein [Tanacetum coccineum]